MKNILYAAVAASLMCLLTGGIITLATAAPSDEGQLPVNPTKLNIEAELAAHLDSVIAAQLANIQRQGDLNLK